MDKRTVALGLAAAGAVAAAVIVTVEGKGKPTSPEHDAVAAYIKSVDGIEQHMQVPLTKALKAYRSFSSSGTRDPAVEPQLAQAERTLKSLKARLQALPAPKPTVRLRRLLLHLVAAEVGIAHEVDRLAAFAPKFNALLGRSHTAGVVLGAALRAVKPPKPHQVHGTKAQVKKAVAAFQAEAAQAAAKQADAVDAYDAQIAAVLRGLHRLQPPRVMAPAYRAQLQALAASRKAGAALAVALRGKDRSHVPVLGRRFTLANRQAGSVRAQTLQIAAIKAYNARVKSIAAASRSVQDEVARLQRSVG